MSLEKPILIYDGDCGFCTVWVQYWMQQTRDRVLYAPSQQIGNQYPEIAAEEFARSVWLVHPDGRRTSAGQAVLEVMAFMPGKTWLLWFYRHVPGFAAVTETFYRFVAEHRQFFSRLTKVLRYPARKDSRFIRFCQTLAVAGFLMGALVKFLAPPVETTFFVDGGLPMWMMPLVACAETSIALLLIPRVTATFGAILGTFMMVGAFVSVFTTGWLVLFPLPIGMTTLLLLVGWAKRDGLAAWLDDDGSCSLPRE